MYSHAAFEKRTLWAMVTTFLLVFFVELLWDVRDVKGDRAASVLTIPLWLGEPRARVGLHLINFLATGVMVAAVIMGVFPAPYWIAVPHFLVVATFIEWYFSRADRQAASHMFLLYCAGVMFITIGIAKLGIAYG
jgi:4-hydroxybenzoate polyprenyltransferase